MENKNGEVLRLGEITCLENMGICK